MTVADVEVPQVARPPKPKRAARRLLVSLVVFLAVVIAALWYIGVFGGNVRSIESGRAYRSGTITGASYTGITARWAGNDLETVLKRNRIGTVISLRAGSLKDDWYREELDTCARQGVAHVDLPISARSLPPPPALANLVNLFDHARYPILMHCQAGADRTGLASTIYATLYERLPLDRAESEELTWRYGHFPVDKTRAMDEFFDLYRRTSGGLDLREWILNRYPDIYAERSVTKSPGK
jgi:hypothetical protein